MHVIDYRQEEGQEAIMSAIFIGWQLNSAGQKVFPLFNIIGGERNGSTVTDKTLISLGIEIPEVKK